MPLQYRLVALLQAGVTSNLPETVPQVILKMSCHSSFLSSSVLHFSIGECLVNKMRGWVTVTRKHTHRALPVRVAVCSCGSACLLWSPAVCPGGSEGLPWHSSASDSSSVRPDSCPAAAAQHLCSPVPGQQRAGIAAEECTKHLRLLLWTLCKMNWELQVF